MGKGYPRFTKAEEASLARAVRTGEAAFQALVMSQMEWAMKLAQPFASDHVGQDDAKAEAMSLMCKYIRRWFDPSRSRLTTALGHYIPQRLATYANRQRTLLRLPSKGQRPAGNRRAIWDRAVNMINEGLGDHQVPVTADPSGDYDDAEEREVLLAKVRNAMQIRLTDRERYVLNGVVTGEHTLKAIGSRIGISKERVRQIRDEAIGKIRRAIARESHCDNASVHQVVSRQ